MLYITASHTFQSFAANFGPHTIKGFEGFENFVCANINPQYNTYVVEAGLDIGPL